MSKRIAHHVSLALILYLSALVLGVVLDAWYPTSLVPGSETLYLGLVLLVGGPFVLMRAQQFRRSFYELDDKTKHAFAVGPYRWSRHPSYLALMIIFLGFALLVNSLMLFVVLIGLVITFSELVIPHEEQLLEKEVGGIYEKYKKHIPMWM